MGHSWAIQIGLGVTAHLRPAEAHRPAVSMADTLPPTTPPWHVRQGDSVSAPYLRPPPNPRALAAAFRPSAPLERRCPSAVELAPPALPRPIRRPGVESEQSGTSARTATPRHVCRSAFRPWRSTGAPPSPGTAAGRPSPPPPVVCRSSPFEVRTSTCFP
jgi:hypothetical protein